MVWVTVLEVAAGGLVAAMVGALVSRLWCRRQGRESCHLDPLHDRVIEGFGLVGLLIGALLATQHAAPAGTTPVATSIARPATTIDNSGTDAEEATPPEPNDAPDFGLNPWL